MVTYALRRLLLMIPTFFGISLVVFLVLNLAPGRPGAQGDEAADMRSVETQESFRIFREQFSLDKPVLLNLNFTVTREHVQQLVTQLQPGAGAPVADRIAARNQLEDLGSFAVPHLVAILRETAPEAPASATLLDLLELSSRRPLVRPFDPKPSAELRELNRRLDAENAEIRSFRLPQNASVEARRAASQQWFDWFERHAPRFEHGFGEKLRVLFLETRFAVYWRNLLHLDFGVSLITRQPVMSTLVGKLKYSLPLSVGSLALAYALAIPLGVFSAVRTGTRGDRVLTLLLFMLYSLPTFFVATLLLVVFSEGSAWPSLRLFPTGGFQSTNAEEFTVLESLKDIAWHLVLPLGCMTYGLLAALSRYMRTGLLEVIRSDYVRTARAKGLPEYLVIGKHAMRNGVMPILTLLSGLLPAALGGSVIVEYIFGIPGMGLWMVDAIYQRDYNVIMAVELLSTVLVLVGVLLTDLGYALVDPRIRYS